MADMIGVWIDKVHDRHPPTKIILDMDSSVNPTHGEQETSPYHGHFGCTCYHPLFQFNHFGDLEWSSLLPGNVHSTDDWNGVRMKSDISALAVICQGREAIVPTRFAYCQTWAKAKFLTRINRFEILSTKPATRI